MGHAENPVKAACRELLEARGWRVFNRVTGQFKTFYGARVTVGQAGEPDLHAVSRIGRWMYIETKRPKGGRFQQSQLEFAEDMRQRGVPCVAIKDPEELAEWLNANAAWMEGIER